jgi:hypothetical protein
VYAAASLMKKRGATDRARAYLDEVYAELTPNQAATYRETAAERHVDRFWLSTS